MKVANILEEARYGGPQARVFNICNALKIYTNLKQINIIPKKSSSFFYNLLSTNGIPSRKIYLTKLSKSLSGLLIYFISFPIEVITITYILYSNHVDIVHCNGALQFKGIIAAKLLRKKVIWHMNDTYTPFIFIPRFFSYFCDGYIFSSERTKNYYKNYLAKKDYKIIYPPVSPEFFFYNKNNNTKKYLPNAKINILAVGNINPGKGYMDIVAIAKILFKKNKNIHITIVGEVFENQKQYYKILCDEMNSHQLTNITFIKNCKDVLPLLNETDIFLCASLYEAGPMSVFEAMAKELPIVSTDVGDLSKLTGDSNAALLSPVHDIETLSKDILRLSVDANLRKSLGNKAREIAKKELSTDKAAELHHSFYNFILGNNG